MKVYIYTEFEWNEEKQIYEISYSESEEYEGEVALCKGDVNVPPPSEEEKALRRQQAEALAQQTALLQQQMAKQEQWEPYLLANMGYKIEDGDLVKLSEEERLGLMSPLERSQYDLAQQYQQAILEQMPVTKEIGEMALERQRAALAGELPVSPALEKELALQERELEEQLSRRLGPNWRETTPGIQALAKMKESHELLREEARRGEIASGEGLMLAQMGRAGEESKWRAQLEQQKLGNISGVPTWNMPIARGYGQLSQMYGLAQQPYERYRNLQTMAMAQSQANKAAGLGGLMGLAGSLAMAAGMAA